MPTTTELDETRVSSSRRRAGNSTRSTLTQLSERWIPMGISRCHASTPWGSATGRICRTPESLELELRAPHLPSVRFIEAHDGRLRLELRYFPASPMLEVSSGTLHAHAANGRVTLRFEGHEEPLDLILTL